MPEHDPNFTPVALTEPEFTIGRQGIHFKQFYEHKGVKLQVMIYVDSYDYQSWARVSALDPKRFSWRMLDSIHFSRMRTTRFSHEREVSVQQKASILKDRDELLRSAQMLMFMPEESVT